MVFKCSGEGLRDVVQSGLADLQDIELFVFGVPEDIQGITGFDKSDGGAKLFGCAHVNRVEIGRASCRERV